MRQKQESILRILVILIPLLLLLDVGGMVGGLTAEERRSVEPEPITVNAEQRAFLLREYETCVTEIHLRLEHEHALFLVKFTLVGAVIGLVFYQRLKPDAKFNQAILRSPWIAICCWAATLVAALIDIRRQFNVEIIVELGTWIQTVEGLLLPDGVLGWEQFIRGSPLWASRWFPLLRSEREILTWVIYLIAIVLLLQTGRDQRSKRVLQIARLFGPLSFCLFGLVSFHFHYRKLYYLLYSILVVIVGVSVFLAWLRSLERRSD